MKVCQFDHVATVVLTTLVQIARKRGLIVATMRDELSRSSVVGGVRVDTAIQQAQPLGAMVHLMVDDSGRR